MSIIFPIYLKNSSTGLIPIQAIPKMPFSCTATWKNLPLASTQNPAYQMKFIM